MRLQNGRAFSAHEVTKAYPFGIELRQLEIGRQQRRRAEDQGALELS